MDITVLNKCNYLLEGRGDLPIKFVYYVHRCSVLLNHLLRHFESRLYIDLIIPDHLQNSLRDKVILKKAAKGSAAAFPFASSSNLGINCEPTSSGGSVGAD